MSKRNHIVCTTIFEPDWLQGYLDNLRQYGHDADTRIDIIVDRKTPPSVAEAAAAARRDGFDVWCPDAEEQEDFLKRLGAAGDFIPWNTDNRRNIGFLAALEDDAELLVSIDDDNYCLPDSDFLGTHAICGGPPQAETQLASGAPWFNICSLLDAGGQTTYPRGLPYAARDDGSLAQPGALDAEAAQRRVAVNAGLWLEDPDVDAITRLCQRPRVRAGSGDVALAPETWSPINTQNTGLTRDAAFAYYYVRMGYPLQGLRIDRYGDILSGYFVQKCAKHLGDSVHIGAPVAEHRRSQHNLFKDLYFELAGMVIVEELLPWLQALRLSGNTYPECYAALADALETDAHRFQGFVWDDGGRDFLVETARLMRHWLTLVERFR